MKFCLVFFMMVLFMCVSCDRDVQLRADLAKMCSQPINLCVDSLVCMNKKPLVGNCNSKLRLCIYFDSVSCVPCNVRTLYQWHSYLDSINHNLKEPLLPVFLLSPSEKQLQDENFMELLQKLDFDYPIYVDTLNVFKRHNLHIPKSAFFHTFLLDEKSNVLLVGNPMKNMKVKALLDNVLEERFESGNPETREHPAVDSLSNKIIDVVQRK